MAILGRKFNAAEHEEMGDFSALPISGNPYHVQIQQAKVKDNKARSSALDEGNDIPGKVFTFPLKIVSGDYKGNLVFVGLNLEHTSEQAVDIAYRELTSMANAAGVSTFEDTDDLTFKEVLIDVKTIPATAQYPEKSVVKKYYPVKGIAKPAPRAAEAYTETVPAPKKGKRKVSFED